MSEWLIATAEIWPVQTAILVYGCTVAPIQLAYVFWWTRKPQRSWAFVADTVPPPDMPGFLDLENELGAIPPPIPRFPAGPPAAVWQRTMWGYKDHAEAFDDGEVKITYGGAMTKHMRPQLIDGEELLEALGFERVESVGPTGLPQGEPDIHLL